jgi:hypothetical protein
MISGRERCAPLAGYLLKAGQSDPGSAGVLAGLRVLVTVNSRQDAGALRRTPLRSARKVSRLKWIPPFLDELKPVYEDHVKAVATRINVTVSRADDFFAASSIISDVWNAINRAKVLIADCTGRNPNVFYELGIAHTLGKPVILIAQSKDDIPFDVQHIRAILYDFTPREMQKFESTLKRTLVRELTLPRTLSDFLARERRNSG